MKRLKVILKLLEETNIWKVGMTWIPNYLYKVNDIKGQVSKY